MLYRQVCPYIGLSRPAPSHPREKPTNTSGVVFHHSQSFRLFLRRTPSASSLFGPRLIVLWEAAVTFSLVSSSYSFFSLFHAETQGTHIICMYLVQVFALECYMRRRGRLAFHRPLSFILDVASTILVQLHTRLCCVYTRPTRY